MVRTNMIVLQSAIIEETLEVRYVMHWWWLVT